VAIGTVYEVAELGTATSTSTREGGVELNSTRGCFSHRR
jgi:hypothetical protein